MNAFRDISPGGPPKVVAHRGDSFYAPENTLVAARKGHAAGAFAWELDVHLSRDGVPVVIHDETLGRTTDAASRFAGDPREESGFRVADFTWAELASLDAGSWFVDPRGGRRTARDFGTTDRITAEDRRLFASGTVRIPRLDEALDLTRDLDWRINVELKTFPEPDPGLLPAVFEAIDRTGTAGRVLLSCFDHDDAARSVRTRPEIPVGVLSETPLHRPSFYVREVVGGWSYHPSASALGATSPAYRTRPEAASLRFLDGDLPTWVYTVNDPVLARHLADLGVTGIFTDDPGGIMKEPGLFGPGDAASLLPSRRA